MIRHEMGAALPYLQRQPVMQMRQREDACVWKNMRSEFLLWSSHDLKAVGTGDATLNRGLESLERCWQSHAGPSLLIPSLQPRRSGSGSLDLPAELDTLTNDLVTTPAQLPISSAPASQPGLSAAPGLDRHLSKEGSAQASGQQGAAVAPVSHLCMGNATLDRNLQSLQRRWESQKSRCA